MTVNKFCGTIVCICLFSSLCPSLKSQTLSPDQWEGFISERNTSLVSDTFRMQRFEGGIKDNWDYRVEGSHSVIDASASGIEGVSQGKLLKLGLNSTLSFDKAYSSAHSSITGGLAYAPKGVMIGENMSVVMYHGSEMETNLHSNVTSNDFSVKLRHVNIFRNLYGLDLQTAPEAGNTKGGYYGIDSVYLYGNIARYSLFKGEGSWGDAANWSHLPAERHRHGLVKGNVTVRTDTHCDTVSLKGELTIRENTTLSLRQLSVFGETSVIRNEGLLLVEGCVELIRSFPGKGVWCFVSFPFDVYAEGIDPSFSLKDETPNAGGNYMYVLTYDGKRRNEEMTTWNNWLVMPEAAASGNLPVFEKNKGYLLAIDEWADRTSLCFSSRKGTIPQSFGRSGELTIDIPAEQEGEGVHAGWQLCGNPLPAPLHVSELAHPDLDGYVYFYTGEDYSAIPVTANYSIPPYSAFFLKAAKSVTLGLGLKADEGVLLLSAPSPSGRIMTGPESGNPVDNPAVPGLALGYFDGKDFNIVHAPQSGTVTVVDAGGRLCVRSAFAAGETRQIALPEQPGFYVLVVRTKNRRTEYKFVR